MDKELFKASKSNISSGGLLVRRHYCIGMRQRGKPAYGEYVIPKFDGGQSQDGRTYKKNVWDEIYKFLCENEVDVEEYVEFVFDTCRSINTPNALKNQELVERFKHYISGRSKPLIWEMEVNKIMTEFMFKSTLFPNDLSEAYRCVLLDDDIQVSPLTRYSYGVFNNMEFIVQPLEEAAFRQYYVRRFFYDRFYKDKIPENIRKRVENLDDAC